MPQPQPLARYHLCGPSVQPDLALAHMIRYTAYSEEARSPTIALGRSSGTRSWTCPATIRCLARLVGVPRSLTSSWLRLRPLRKKKAVMRCRLTILLTLVKPLACSPPLRSQDIGWYLRTIEKVLISVLAEYGVKAGIEPGLASPVVCVCVCVYLWACIGSSPFASRMRALHGKS